MRTVVSNYFGLTGEQLYRDKIKPFAQYWLVQHWLFWDADFNEMKTGSPDSYEKHQHPVVLYLGI